MRVYFIVFSLFLLRSCLFSQNYIQAGADTVYSYSFGSGQTFGQDSAYFPENVLGLPDSSASPTSPSATPSEICSLGEGGEIVLGFKNRILLDGPGPDFIVFENGFYINGDSNSVFVEPATVSVSRDGITFTDFPIDTLTLQGCAGMTPTKNPLEPFDPVLAGGDAFDLSVIGMDSVKYIKIKDFVYYLKSHPSHPYYSPILSGFDLDAVTGRYLVSEKVSGLFALGKEAKVYSYGNSLRITSSEKMIEKVEIYSVLGRKILEKKLKTFFAEFPVANYNVIIVRVLYLDGSNSVHRILFY